MNQNLKTLGIFLLVATGLMVSLGIFLSQPRGREAELNARFDYKFRQESMEKSAECDAYFKQDRAAENHHRQLAESYMAECDAVAVECEPLTNTRVNQRNGSAVGAIFAFAFAVTSFILARRPT